MAYETLQAAVATNAGTANTQALTLVGAAPSAEAEGAIQINKISFVPSAIITGTGAAGAGATLGFVKITEPGDTGYSSASAATTLTDASKAWGTNLFAGKTVVAGASTGVVATNTATVLTLTAAGWTGGTPATVSYYTVGAVVVLGSVALNTGVNAALQTELNVPIANAVAAPGDSLFFQWLNGSTGLAAPTGVAKIEIG